MAAIEWNLSWNAADPHRLATFWALALGYWVADDNSLFDLDNPDRADIIHPDNEDPSITFIRKSEIRDTRNRVQVEIHVTAPAGDSAERERRVHAKVGELVSAGGTVVREDFSVPGSGWVDMLDPEGNEFSVQ